MLAVVPRKADHKISDIFIKRWSPRAMSGEVVSDEELKSLFEAARWAPSSYNGQPWRFIYAKKDSPHWNIFFDLLDSFNRTWCHKAAVLVVIISRKKFEFNEKPERTHSFDTGAAWENLALQGSINGLVVHGMEGFNYDSAQKVLKVPERYQVEAMCAIGRPGKLEDLPKELREREFPSDRKKLDEIVASGAFNPDWK